MSEIVHFSVACIVAQFFQSHFFLFSYHHLNTISLQCRVVHSIISSVFFLAWQFFIIHSFEELSGLSMLSHDFHSKWYVNYVFHLFTVICLSAWKSSLSWKVHISHFNRARYKWKKEKNTVIKISHSIWTVGSLVVRQSRIS